MNLHNPLPQNLSFGSLQENRGLGVIPIVSEGEKSGFSYLTLDEALDAGVIRITETSESGNVPELLLENDGELPIFLMDGEELVGAKQNRVLNLSVMAPAKQKIVIPVSCVESGRWRYAREDFDYSDRAHFAKGRAKKMASVSESLLQSGTRRSNQGEVWSDIDMKFSRMRKSSGTSAMSDMFNEEKQSLDDYVNAIKVTEQQSGAFFFVHGDVIGFDLFDKASTFVKLSQKLIKSYAIDAMEQPERVQPEINIDQMHELIKEFQSQDWESFPGTGIGKDYRFRSPGATGGALVIDETTIHVSGFKLDVAQRSAHERNLASIRARRRMRTR